MLPILKSHHFVVCVPLHDLMTKRNSKPSINENHEKQNYVTYMMFHLSACVSVPFVRRPHPVFILGLLKVTDPTPIYCSWVHPIRSKNLSRPSLHFWTIKCISRKKSSFFVRLYPPSTYLCMIEKKLRKRENPCDLMCADLDFCRRRLCEAFSCCSAGRQWSSWRSLPCCCLDRTPRLGKGIISKLIFFAGYNLCGAQCKVEDDRLPC